MRQRRNSLGFELFRNRVELVPGFRWLQPVVLENFSVDPEPVGPMYVNRNGLPLPIMNSELLDLIRDDLVPSLFLGNRGQVAEKTLLGPLVNGHSEQLSSRRGIAGGDSRFESGCCSFTAASGDRHILPTDALLLQIVLEDAHSCSLSARCPPVQHLDAFSRKRMAADRGAQCSRQGRYFER